MGRFSNWVMTKIRKTVPDRMQPTEMVAKSGHIAEQAELIPYPTSPTELYLMRQYTPILQTVCIKLRDEIWRKPPYVEREYANRCPACKINYEVETPECKKCGGPTIEPDDNDRRVIEAFMTKMNDSDHDFIHVGKMFEDDINVTDDGWLIGVKDYVMDKEGNILDYEPREIYRGKPGKIWLVRDRMLRKTGEDYQLKRGFFTCVLHREGNLQSTKGRCKICNRKLHPVTEIALDHESRPSIGYIDGEIFHDSRYQPSELYGFSNILCLWTLSQTLINMDSQQNRTYKHDRPPKMALFVNTDNPQQFNTMAKKQDEKKAKNPNYVPRYAFSSSRGAGAGGGNPINVVNFTPSYTDLQNIEQRKEIKERISALYGVSNILVNDTSASGGLNNEGLQIRVTTRAVETAHTQYHERVFKWIVDFLQVEGWVIRFPEPIEADKAAIQQRKLQNFQMLLQLIDRKVKPVIEDAEDLTFTFDIDDVEPQEIGGGGGFGGFSGFEQNSMQPRITQEPKVASAYIQNGNTGIHYPIYIDDHHFPPGGSNHLPASNDGCDSDVKKKNNNHGIDMTISKKRIYLKNPEDAPEGANVQQGPHGGHYYDSDSSASTKPSKPARTRNQESKRNKPIKTRRPAKLSKRYALEKESMKIFTKQVKNAMQTPFLKDPNNKPIPHPFDAIDNDNKIAYELKAQTAGSKTVTKITKWQQERKLKWAKKNGYKPVVVLIELNGEINMYKKEGVKPYRRAKRNLWRTVKR